MGDSVVHTTCGAFVRHTEASAFTLYVAKKESWEQTALYRSFRENVVAALRQDDRGVDAFPIGVPVAPLHLFFACSMIMSEGTKSSSANLRKPAASARTSLHFSGMPGYKNSSLANSAQTLIASLGIGVKGTPALAIQETSYLPD